MERNQGRPKQENVSEATLARRRQRLAKANGTAKPKGRQTICEKVKNELKTNGVEGVKKLMDSKKISKLGLKKCVKEGKLDRDLLGKLGIKMNKLKTDKKPVKVSTKPSAKKKDKDEKPRGGKAGGGGGGGSQTSSIAPSEKLVQQIAPSQPSEPLSALQFLNRRRFEEGEAPLKPITQSELARAKVLVAKAQEAEFGQSFPDGVDPHAKSKGFKTQNPLSAHDNITGTTRSEALAQNATDRDFEAFTRELREANKKEAQTNLESLLSNVDKAVARGFEKSELRLDAPVLNQFVLQGEPTQQSTLQPQSGFNQGNVSQPKTIAQTQAEQDQERVARNYQHFDHSVISQYASGNPTEVNVELSSNQDELSEESFDPEEDELTEESEEEEESSSLTSKPRGGLFV